MEEMVPYYFNCADLPDSFPPGPVHGEFEAAIKQVLPINQPPSGQVPSKGIRRLIQNFLSGGETEHQLQTRRAIFIVGQILKSVGFISLECHYDGGQDEGWAFLDWGVTESTKLNPKQVGELLRGSPLGDAQFNSYEDYEVGKSDERQLEITAVMNPSVDECIQDNLDDFLMNISTVLLGEGYGTGDYYMAGQFRVDLKNGEIIDVEMTTPPDFREMIADFLDDGTSGD